ncbi:hypothetical protein PTSG_03572 [Salpingoeca rosetta]|uniref:Uncharacterized protein n=1 Tax=Salpingoeca rosetta (strain ATCC 50818 / BSB-021) TaxID=946362 RepID=F2U5Z8_SALR5|nr:uncharacterized protein PTSG_03572 [Salpingoeca rosetta]EGD82939.1 hypothetical protein PTSG_03572 [Salpingoeca rosetta]|eukprot:XP_004995303.1 hypothetical protein PTSG_03572 [Salpingoeca rosetta]
MQQQRPPSVQAACDTKFTQHQQAHQQAQQAQQAHQQVGQGWVYTGEGCETLYLDADGRYTTSDALFSAILAKWITHSTGNNDVDDESTEQQGCGHNASDATATATITTASTSTTSTTTTTSSSSKEPPYLHPHAQSQPQPEQQRFPRLLDLGTGTASLLAHLHTSLGWPFDRMLGISAVDERSPSTTPAVPDSSYCVANIDNLSSLAEEPQRDLTGAFDVIWSSHTFYHLVDPIAAVCAVYDLLAPGGMAFLRHVPIAGTGLSREQLRSYLRQHHFRACVAPMPDSPGNDMVLLRKPTQADLQVTVLPPPPPALSPPFTYTGTVQRSGTYQYALLQWQPEANNDHPPRSEDDVAQQQQKQQHVDMGLLEAQDDRLSLDPAFFVQAIMGVHARELVGATPPSSAGDQGDDGMLAWLAAWSPNTCQLV